MDITYIPMARGFVYRTAVADWFSRRVLAWRVSSAWMAAARGVITCSSNGCGGRSNTKKSCVVNVSSRLETTRSFIGDGGWPPEVGLQGQASNRHKLRG